MRATVRLEISSGIAFDAPALASSVQSHWGITTVWTGVVRKCVQARAVAAGFGLVAASCACCLL